MESLIRNIGVRIEQTLYNTRRCNVFELFRNPGNIEKPVNALTSIAIQCCGAVVCVYFILTPQFFFVSMCAYFSTLMDDIKSIIHRLDRKPTKLKQNLVEMVSLHRKCLE